MNPAASRARGPAPFVVAVVLSACGADPDPRVEPAALHFTPAHPELPLRLEHHGDAPLTLSKIRLDHREADWAAFTIADPVLPRQIEPGGAVTLHLRVDVDHFGGHGHASRPGAAALTFLADGQPRRVPLRFSAPEPSLLATLLRLGLLLGLAAALFVPRRRPPWSFALPALAVLATTPVGFGLCPGSFDARLSAADLQQCADGRGGLALQILPHPEGLGLVLALVLFAGLGRISGGADDLRRMLALALALVVVALAGGSLDPQTLLEAQAGLRWGLWMQPFALALLAVAAALEVRAARAVSPRVARVAALGLAALLTALGLGGPDFPGVEELPHAAGIAAGVAVWSTKVAVVAWLLTRVPLSARSASVLAWSLLPLALAQILVSAWLLRGA